MQQLCSDDAAEPSSKSQMAAEDPLAQFHPVSLHPPASLHSAASCVTSPATLDHPRLQRPSLLHRQRSHSRRDSAPLSGRKRGRRKDCSSSLDALYFLRIYLHSPSLYFTPYFYDFTHKVVCKRLKRQHCPHRRIIQNANFSICPFNLSLYSI